MVASSLILPPEFTAKPARAPKIIVPSKTLSRAQLDPKDFVRQARKNGRFICDSETYGLDPTTGRLKGLSLKTGDHVAWYGFGAFGGMSQIQVLRALAPMFRDKNLLWINHNVKFDLKWLVHNGVKVKNRLADTLIASYLLNEDRKFLQMGDGKKPSKYGLKKLVYEHFEHRMDTYAGTKEEGNLFGPPLGDYAKEDVVWTEKLWDLYEQDLKDEDILDVFERIEMPLVPILADMELTGILIDPERLKNLWRRYEAKQHELAEQIFKMAGQRFDLGKTQEVARVLYRDGVPTGPKGKRRRVPTDDPENEIVPGKSGQYPTGNKLIEYFSGEFPIITAIIDWRSYGVLISTFCRGLINKSRWSSDGRVRCNFNQTGTKIGRLSSTEPNMQNVPRPDTDEPNWKEDSIRGAIIAGTGNLIVDRDLSQIELRMMAHWSQDPNMLEVYRSGGTCIEACHHFRDHGECKHEVSFEVGDKQITCCGKACDGFKGAVAKKGEGKCRHTDIHTRTAEDIGCERNPTAKNINFGACYRIGPRKLRGYAKVKTTEEAKKFLWNWYSTYGGVVKFHQWVERNLPRWRFIMKNLTGRRRRLYKDYKKNDYRAVTQAIQFAISGSSQDLLKIAMRNWWNEKEARAEEDERWANAHAILQVHDEFAVECPEAIAQENLELLGHCMETADGGQLAVPVKSEGGTGHRWTEAH